MTARQNCDSELTNYKACNTFSISSSKTRDVFSLVAPITDARRAFYTATTRHPRSRSWVRVGRPSDPLFVGSIFRRQLGDHRSETFIEIFWERRNLSSIHDASRELSASPVGQVFRSGYEELVRVSRSKKESSAG